MFDRCYSVCSGRQLKSKGRTLSAATGLAIDDLSSSNFSSTSSSSSSSPSTSEDKSSSAIPLRNKSRSYRLVSPIENTSSKASATGLLSDDSLSEQNEHPSVRRPPRSAFTYKRESAELNDQSRVSTAMAPSIYLIELTTHQSTNNCNGLTKTATCVWKNSETRKDKQNLNSYPQYSIEQVSPIPGQNRRSIPVTSRHVTLQRARIDYWSNAEISADSMLTSSCQHHIGSASNLLSSSFEDQQPEIQSRSKSNGTIISITSTQRRQPSLLNKSHDTQWNIEGDGKQLRYSNLKWYSVDQLQKTDRRWMKRQRSRSREQHEQTSDCTTDPGSSSELYYQSAPPILARRSPKHKIRSMEQGNYR
jgi:hypothetical protein